MSSLIKNLDIRLCHFGESVGSNLGGGCGRVAVTHTGVYHRQVSTIPLLGPNAPGHMGLMS